MVEISDEDSNKDQVDEEMLLPPYFLKMPNHPGTLLLTLREKRDSFINNIDSLGKSFGPLLHKY